MLRTLDVVLIAALLAGATWTFKVKHDSEAALARVEKLRDQIRAEKEAIDILRADWALLTSPDRLQKLVERYGDELGLQPLQPSQIDRIDKLPQKPAPVFPSTGFTQAFPGDDPDSAGASDPSIITGGVKPVE